MDRLRGHLTIFHNMPCAMFHELWSPNQVVQNSKGYAKAYQVKQVLKAIERLEIEHGRER